MRSVSVREGPWRRMRAAIGLPVTLWLITALCVIPEAVLEGSDAGLWGSMRWRGIAYGWGGFWPGLLRGWQPNFHGQPAAMFVSYGFLHGGFSHVAGNMLTLWLVGLPLVARVGQWRFAALYAASQVGGGIGYLLLATGTVPMVGASGALFGLAGAWAAWDYVDRFSATERLWPVARLVLLLAALNLFVWWAMNGQLAWQTHLGGFAAGWIVALLLDPRPRRRA